MLRDLWRNRNRSPIGSSAWFRTWAKRLLTFPALFGSICRQRKLQWMGARIDPHIFISRCILNGTARNLSIGDQTFIGRVTLHLHDSIEIGRNVVINDGLILLTASHDVSSNDFRSTTGRIKIGDYAWIASNSILLPGVEIGEGAVVGAGAVVRENVLDYSVVLGNPARPTDKSRANTLSYSPIRMIAAVQAWLGPRSADSVM